MDEFNGSDLSKEEVESLSFWIDGGHHIMRSIILGESIDSAYKNTEEFTKAKSVSKHLVSALKKLPDSHGTFWRGMKPQVDNSGKEKELAVPTEGQVLTMELASLSSDRKIARMFSGDKGILFQVKAKHAKDISVYDKEGYDQNELVMIKSEFKVRKVSDGSPTIVEMEEV